MNWMKGTFQGRAKLGDATEKDKFRIPTIKLRNCPNSTY